MTTSIEAVVGLPARQADEIAQLKARVKELEDGLAMLAEGDTPWLDGYSGAAWEIMAKYAGQLLEGGGA